MFINEFLALGLVIGIFICLNVIAGCFVYICYTQEFWQQQIVVIFV